MMTGGFGGYPNGTINIENVTSMLNADGAYTLSCSIVFYSDAGITEVSREDKTWRVHSDPGTESQIIERCETALLGLPNYDHMAIV